MPFPPKKKKPGDFALLLEPEDEPGLDAADDEIEDDDDFGDMPDDPDADPLAASDESSDEPSSIDPEQAALCETLGFTDPEQQQALIDLVKLVTSPADPMSSDSGSALPPLPESTY